MTIIISLISLIVAWFILAPFIQNRVTTLADTKEQEQLNQQDNQERRNQLLVDLELDYRNGRITEKDYSELVKRIY
jgi:flagellar biosynthesis/type III secretory pathway M-ring protein FliF/YscJ